MHISQIEVKTRFVRTGHGLNGEKKREGEEGDRQAGRLTDRLTDRQTDRHTD